MAELRSTIEDINRYIHSNLWFDISLEMEAWLEDIRDQLESCSDTDTIRRLQGNAEAIRRAIELPKQLIDLLQAGAAERER